MSRPQYESETFAPGDGLPEGLEHRKSKSERQRCKRKRARSIRKGIDSYFEKKNLRDQIGDDFDDDDLDMGEEESWYH
ncbi:PA3496 family putative envelope integrity protein [Parendozoicomonas haliclonae]|uniref:Uncharacterized protein n=1 Tax=Parendozoicomonas haliclonae TaxID=1960125 RepID=A0A1X7AGB2_9GAMM|nr:hypothetical protein [Parendozoicomonas haliclonae]SMA37782.1 hypothetical protein EHSB41UT_00788 [Parendozoicomonas haliclonae]